MKILTILIPVYNTEKYIRRCLDSILLDEVLKDIEVLIVNDGSKDNSVKIIKEYEKKYPETIVFIDKENGGHGSTINKGLENATGKYFKVLDSDDWLDSCNFIKFVKKLKKCDEDLIVNPYYQEYVYNGVQLLFEYPKFEFDKIYHFNDLKIKDFNNFYFVMASSTYKLEVLKKAKLKLFEKTFYVDMQYNVVPVKYVDTIKFEKENLYRYFIGRPTQSMNVDSMIRNMPDHDKVFKFLISYYMQEKSNLSKIKQEYIRMIILLMAYTHINLIGMQWKNRHESYKLVKNFERYLRNTDQEIYQEIMKYSYMKYGKKVGYLNVWFCNKLFNKALRFASRVKRRICK